MTFSFSLPTEWSLPITPSQREMARQNGQSFNYHRREANINALCFDVFFAWFQDEYDPEVQAWLSPRERQGLWGMVTGSIVISQGKRLLLLPNETSDTEVLDIPQEWIDIPSWIADYILAIQMDPEGDWLTVWGYTTQAQVKDKGLYDECDRTYALKSSHLHRDLNALSTILHYCPDAVTQVVTTSLPLLCESLVNTLIQKVGKPELAFPRQTIPFSQWAALLERPDWRQLLLQQRLGNEPTTVITRLTDWFQPGANNSSWQTIETELFGQNLGSLIPSFRNADLSNNSVVRRVKPVTLFLEQSTLTVILLIQVDLEEENRISVIIQIHPNRGNPHIPEGVELCLGSATGEVLQSIQAQSQDDYIQLTRFRCSLSTCFQIQIKFCNTVITETFTA